MKTSLILCLISAAVCFAKLTINVEDVYVKLGEEAIIPCNYESDSDPDDSVIPKFKWYHYKNGDGKRFYIYRDGDASGVSAEATAANLAVLDDGSLKVPVATWEVAENFGELACEVELGKLASTTSDKFKLVVISIPKPDAKPTTTQDENEGFDQDDLASIIGSCESPPSFPAGTITFFKNGQSLSSETGDSSIAEILESGIERLTPDGHTFITSKDLMKSLDKSDHKAEFVCNVKVEVDGKILYEANETMPVVNIRYETDMVEWAEEPTAYLGETITLRCNANGFPEPTITINGEDVAEKEITVTVTEDTNGKTYQCSATNSEYEEGIKSSIYTITVYKLDEPVISGDKVKDGKGTVKEGDTAIFGCAATGNPPPSLAWYDAKDAKVSDSGSLTIKKATMDDTARYTCRASNGHQNLQRTVTLDVDVQGLRISGEAQEVKEGKEGDTVHLECAVYANPIPTFEWSFEDAEPTETKTKLMYTSQVNVGPLTPDDSEKEYVCTATSEYGSVKKSFKMPAIAAASSGATTGIIIAVLLIILVIAIVVAVLYNKGIICKKQEKGDESAEDEIDVAINNDERDLEAGNGKPDAPPAEEEHRPTGNSEEEKLMNGEEIEK